MNKIFIIVQREFSTRVKKKSFILLTILMPFIFAAIIVVPIWLASIRDGEQRTVNVVDRTGRYATLFKDTRDYRFVPVAADSSRFYADDSGVEAVVVITADLIRHPGAVVINSPQPVSPGLLGYVKDVLNTQVRRDKLAGYNVPHLDKIIADVQSTIDVRTAIKHPDGYESASSTDVAMISGFIVTLLIYMFVLMYGMMVMQSVSEEKSNRIVELMVSSVKPFQLMMGKIIGIGLVGIVQLLIWGIMLAVILGVCSMAFGVSLVAQGGPEAAAAMTQAAGGAMTGTQEILQSLMTLPYGELAIMFVLCFVGGYLLYASLLAAVGATINAQEDSSQFITPLMLIMAFGLYAAMYSVENTNGPLAFWSSLFPLTSPIVMMVRIPFGVPLWQEMLSVVILYASSLFFVWISGKIYRVGILMYGKKPSFRELRRWLSYK